MSDENGLTPGARASWGTIGGVLSLVVMLLILGAIFALGWNIGAVPLVAAAGGHLAHIGAVTGAAVAGLWFITIKMASVAWGKPTAAPVNIINMKREDASEAA